MNTQELINTKQQELHKLERKLTAMKLKERKLKTRRKIELGGLVIKSKMYSFPKAVILGALIDAFENLNRDTAIKMLFQSKGESVFMGYGHK